MDQGIEQVGFALRTDAVQADLAIKHAGKSVLKQPQVRTRTQQSRDKNGPDEALLAANEEGGGSKQKPIRVQHLFRRAQQSVYNICRRQAPLADPKLKVPILVDSRRQQLRIPP